MKNRHFLVAGLVLCLVVCSGLVTTAAADDPGAAFWAMYVGNWWDYNGSDIWGGSWITSNDVTGTTWAFPEKTYIIEECEDYDWDNPVAWGWYEISASAIKIWAKEWYDDDVGGWIYLTSDVGLVFGKNPIVVGEDWTTTTYDGYIEIPSEGYYGHCNISLYVDVQGQESVATPLGTYQAYRIYYELHVWEPGYFDEYRTWYYFFVPYVQNVKWQSGDLTETELLFDMYLQNVTTNYILHKDGALWSSGTGWNMGTPPYYAGSGYARDLELLDGGDYVILHKDGAMYDSVDGWTMATPPYYPGSDYAVDIEITASDADCILHKDGALWSSDTGWNMATPPYYAGSGYARDMELLDGGGYVILHKDGAMYDSVDGWNMDTPPYYPGTDWAVDLEVQ